MREQHTEIVEVGFAELNGKRHLFAPEGATLTEWLAKNAVTEVEDDEAPDAEEIGGEGKMVDPDPADEFEGGYRDAAE